MGNLDIYNALKQPPKEALRQIQGGRLSGKTDINPQWRYKSMTEQFGMCGVGWKYETIKVWNEPVADGQVFAFAMIHLYTRQGDSWSDPIPGLGGSMLVEKEKAGLHANDEGYKMAITDALSTAMKMLGVAADIYAGLWDGTTYRDAVETTVAAVEAKQPPRAEPEMERPNWPKITSAQTKKIYASVKEKGITADQAKAYLKTIFNKLSTKELTVSEASRLIEDINAGKLQPKNHLVEEKEGGK